MQQRPTAFDQLKQFITKQMRMSHLYQPLMLRTLIEKGDELLRLCDEAVANYTGRRGRKLYDHRRMALGDISGTVRYIVLKRAGFRCDLCGISAEERALEVDHILPRRHGGSDDISNFQALCYKCNANKGARDDTNLRAVREALNARSAECAFLRPGRAASYWSERAGGCLPRSPSGDSSAYPRRTATPRGDIF
jgi:hypothetical protein